MGLGFVFFVGIILYSAAGAYGVTCGAGYYLENGICTPCKQGAEPYYCPGDDKRYPCPTTDTDYNSFDPRYQYSHGVENNWAKSGISANSVSACYCVMFFKDVDSDSMFLMQCPFNGNNYWCDNRYWTSAGVGYYLSPPRTDVHYYGVKKCTNAPDNAQYTGPGTPDSADGSVVDANDCPWECIDGYGRVGGECRLLCMAGVTKIHVGKGVAPLFNAKYTRPSLVVSLPGGVCYGDLFQGRGPGINIRLLDTVFHME